MTIEENSVMVTNPLGKRERNIPMMLDWEKKKNVNEEGDRGGWIWILMLPVFHVAVTEMWCVGMESILTEKGNSSWKGERPHCYT